MATSWKDLVPALTAKTKALLDAGTKLDAARDAGQDLAVPQQEFDDARRLYEEAFLTFAEHEDIKPHFEALKPTYAPKWPNAPQVWYAILALNVPSYKDLTPAQLCQSYNPLYQRWNEFTIKEEKERASRRHQQPAASTPASASHENTTAPSNQPEPGASSTVSTAQSITPSDQQQPAVSTSAPAQRETIIAPSHSHQPAASTPASDEKAMSSSVQQQPAGPTPGQKDISTMSPVQRLQESARGFRADAKKKYEKAAEYMAEREKAMKEIEEYKKVIENKKVVAQEWQDLAEYCHRSAEEQRQYADRETQLADDILRDLEEMRRKRARDDGGRISENP